MFLRWQVRQRARPRYIRAGEEPPGPATALLTVSLVEARRVDGKPRQEVVAYLGAIRAGCARDPQYRMWQVRFWRGVAERLDRLGDRLTPENRRALEARIAARVARPTPEEEAAAERELAAWRKGLKAMLAAVAGSRHRGRRPWILPALKERIARDIERYADEGREEDIAFIADRNRVGRQTVRRVLRELQAQGEPRRSAAA